MLAEQTTDPPLDRLQAVADRDDVLRGDRGRARRLRRGERRPLRRDAPPAYALELRLALGASPRAGIALLRMAKARAVARRPRLRPARRTSRRSRRPVLAHRLIVAPEARAAGSRARRPSRRLSRRPRSRREPARRRSPARGGRHRRGARVRLASARRRRSRARARRVAARVWVGPRARTRVRRPCRRPGARCRGRSRPAAHRGSPAVADPRRLDRRPRDPRPARRATSAVCGDRPREQRRVVDSGGSRAGASRLGRAFALGDHLGLESVELPRGARRIRAPRPPSARRRWSASSATPAGTAETGAGCSSAGPPGSTSIRCASTSRASPSGACTGRRLPGAGSSW